MDDLAGERIIRSTPWLERQRRVLDVEALQFYQDETRTRWFLPVDKYPEWERAALALAAELGIRRVRYRGQQTEEVCDHDWREPHRPEWQGCNQPRIVHVFELPETDYRAIPIIERRPSAP